jgi:2-hydroxychromene-2-carboxylate isomerase
VSGPPARFYFDLSSPLAYLAAERVLHVLPRPAEWQPVLARGLAGEDPFHALARVVGAEAARIEVARSAHQLDLQPLRWPDPFPFDSTFAMRVAAYAKSIGRAVPFAQAAFRQAFAGGRSLEDPDNVLIAAAACEMHPRSVLAAAELRSVTRQLADAGRDAASIPIIAVPAIVVGEQVFTGERALEDAAAHMRASAGESAASSPALR